MSSLIPWTFTTDSLRQGILPWGIAFAGYLALVRCFRWRRYNALHRKYNGRDPATLTPIEAQEIMLLSFFYDMPNLSTYSLSFALFKTYGIPTISDLLRKTGELSGSGTVSKRYADTEILIASYMKCPVVSGSLGTSSKQDDPRGAIALARMNWLHNKYNISNEDYLYTMALFVLEPPKWAALWGWRSLSPLECQAFFVFWRDIGHHMGLKDIPSTLDELKDWSEAYEKETMIPAQSNHDVAVATTEELLDMVPNAFGLKNFGRRVTFSLLEERVRMAMMFPDQPRIIHAFVYVSLIAVSVFQHYLCFPRVKPRVLIPDDAEVPKEGSLPRMHPTWFAARPWYKPEPKGIWKLVEKISVSVGFIKPNAVPGPELRSQGFRLEEIGPLRFEQHGHEEVMRLAEGIHGCPISGPWARPPQSQNAKA